MITEDYIGFKASQLLREKGFAEKCQKIWTHDGKLVWACNFMEGESFVDISDIETQARYDGWNTYLQGQYAFLCPTLSVVIKWILEKYNLYIYSSYEEDRGFQPNIISINTGQIYITEMYNGYREPEKVLEIAIEYVLNNLI